MCLAMSPGPPVNSQFFECSFDEITTADSNLARISSLVDEYKVGGLVMLPKCTDVGFGSEDGPVVPDEVFRPKKKIPVW
jgi:hypothetical protein